MAPPLHGIRVLDFGHVLAGPFCTRLLADLGADVVRVESARHPDAPWRSAVDTELGRDVSYLVIGRNKRSVAIDLKTAQGREIAFRLASAVNVVTENFSAGVMERLGLGFDRLSAVNPQLVFLSMSGYGNAGPRRDWTSMNTNLQAYSGLMMVTGREGDPPTAISNSWMDYVGGLHAAFAVVDALDALSRTGAGRRIDLSQFESGVATIAPLLIAAAVEGRAPPRLGNRSDDVSPQGCYRCAGEDEWCAVAVRCDSEWGALVRAMGHPDWASDERFGTNDGRLLHRDELDAYIAAWTRPLESLEVERRLAANSVPAARMRRISDVVEAEDATGVFRRGTGLDGAGLATTLPFTLSPSPVAELRRAPRLGEHTEDVLGAWLGLSLDEIGALVETGVLA